MRRSKAGVLCLAALLLASVLPADRLAAQPASRAPALIEEHLYAGTLETGEKALRALVADAPADAEAQFALGGVLLVRAVERFGQSMYRHGLRAPRDGVLPLFRLPCRTIPTPSRSPTTPSAPSSQDCAGPDAAEAELARVGDRR
jgi:hypothetical protein